MRELIESDERTALIVSHQENTLKGLCDRILWLDEGEIRMIGDTGHDKEVADALGIRCLLVSSGYESSARLASRGAPVLRSVADVPEFFGFAPLFRTPPGGPFPTAKPRCGFPRWPK